MKKAEMEELTRNAFARNAITDYNGEMAVVGKFCVATYNGGDKWDVWLCNPKDIAQGLTNRKIGGIHACIADLGHDTGPFQRLEGEGIYPSMPTDTFLLAAPVLGIKKRKNLHPNSRTNLRNAA